MKLLETLFLQILNMGITAGYIILAVLALRAFLRKAPKIYSYALWAVVGFRLICPISFSSVFSIFNIDFLRIGKAEDSTRTIRYIPDNIGYMTKPNISTGIPATDNLAASSLPAANPVASINPMQIIILFTSVLWIAGIMALLIYSIVSYIRLKKRVSKAVLLRDNIYECDTISSPFVLGLRKPRIYIPFRLSEREQSYILKHELHHLKRLDHIIRPISFLLLMVNWFHPLVWAAYLCMCKDMEMSCDEKVLSDMGLTLKNDYSMSLLSFAANRRFPAASPLAFGETSTKARIKNVLNFKKPKLGLSILIILVCLIAVLACAANPADKGQKETSELDTADSLEITDEARELFRYKNPYIGDNSADSALLNALGISEDVGPFTIELETKQTPYILRIIFDNEVTELNEFNQKMGSYSALLLALIDNADEIQWSYLYGSQGSTNRVVDSINKDNFLDDVKSYGESITKLQELLDILKEMTTYDINSIKNSEENSNFSLKEIEIRETGSELSMEDVLVIKDWSNLTLDYFKSFENAVMDKYNTEGALNSYITFVLPYEGLDYELQVSYLKADNSIESIRLVRQSDSSSINLYTTNLNYPVDTDIATFLGTFVSMNQFMTYQLPEPFINGAYDASLGPAGGNLFLEDENIPECPPTAPIEWCAAGGVLILPGDNTEYYIYVTFENGKLVRGSLYDNHTEYFGEPIVLNDLSEQAIIMDVEHDLYTAAEQAKAEEAGNPIPVEELTSRIWEIYFAREGSPRAYCIFLNHKNFSLDDAIALAESVQFTDKAFQ